MISSKVLSASIEQLNRGQVAERLLCRIDHINVEIVIAIVTASSKEQGFESLLVQHLFASFLGSCKHTKAILASLNNTRQTGTTLIASD
jgi:hypothetical protein